MTHDQDRPEKISHYTSIGGLVGIMRSAALWATHITQLNDPMENRMADRVLEQVRQIDDEFYVATQKVRERDDIFVASLSAAQDHLRMWLPYQAQVEIVFNADLLVDTVESLNGDVAARFTQTSYSDYDLEERLSEAVGPGRAEPEDAYELAILAASHKSGNWAEEREYRFVGLVRSRLGGGQADRVQFRAGPAGLAPYVELYLTPRAPHGGPACPLPFELVNEIRVGPAGDQAALIRAIEVLANQHLSPQGEAWPINPSVQRFR